VGRPPLSDALRDPRHVLLHLGDPRVALALVGGSLPLVLGVLLRQLRSAALRALRQLLAQ
jgi:hypothetical protein